MNNIWQLQEAKSKFSEVVDRALAQGARIRSPTGGDARRWWCCLLLSMST